MIVIFVLQIRPPRQSIFLDVVDVAVIIVVVGTEGGLRLDEVLVRLCVMVRGLTLRVWVGMAMWTPDSN